MTSFPPRISTAWVAIESCFNQSQVPDQVVLCLSRDEFPNGRLPRSIARYIRFGLRILWDEGNIGSYKKLIPVRDQHPEATIVTVDDDLVYSRDMLKELVELAHDAPNTVIGHRGHEVVIGPKGPAPYRTWLPAGRDTASNDILLTGGGGTLYPPDLPSADLLCNRSLAMQLCPTGDDLWFWAAGRVTGVKQICTGQASFEPVAEFVRTPRLFDANVRHGRNDEQLAAVFGFFGWGTAQDDDVP